MANATLKGASYIHGTNPQFLVEKVIRHRIYSSAYWKEHCFALTAESIIDKCVELTHIGGTFEAQKVPPFLCLVLKLLQIQPEKAIVLEYLSAEEFKYLRAIAAIYIRLTFRPVEVFELLEPLLNDYRKLRYRDQSGAYTLTHMDEYVDSLLREERVCDLILPRLTKRTVLEETEGLAERTSQLEDVLLLGRAGLDGDLADDAEASMEVDGPDAGARKRKRGSSSNAGSDSDSSTNSAMRELLDKKRRRKEAEALRRRRREEEDEEDAEMERRRQQALAAGQEDDDDGASQEPDEQDAERYISRSPSRSSSPSHRDSSNGGDRYVSRSPSKSDDDEAQRYVSRSPSRSVSRSPPPDLAPVAGR